MLDDMLARANSVRLPALSRSDRRVLALLLVARVDCAVLYCAVLAVLAVRDDRCVDVDQKLTSNDRKRAF